MKVNHISKSLLVAAITISSFTSGYSQKDFEPVSVQEKAKLRAAVVANPNDLEAHKAYLKSFASADEAKAQYEQWMKKYPKSAAIPQALGEKYGTYSPVAATYYLKAATLNPKNAYVWQRLALAASLSGDNAKQQEYYKNAIAAEPENLDHQWSYFRLFREKDEAFYKKNIWELAKKHPTNPTIASALHIMGIDVRDSKERIAIWEELRSMFPQGDLVTVQVAMSRLGDAYIQAGQYEKAIELSETMIAKNPPARFNFPEKLKLAKSLLAIENKVKEGKQTEAVQMLSYVTSSQRNLFDIGSHVILVKASVLDAAGETKTAYDSLIIFQARTPYMDAKAALEKYGQKLGKSKEQVKQDVRAEVAKNSRPATPFELDLYTSKGKMKLENVKGKVVFLSYWYPGCGPCRGEMPHIEAAIKGIDRTKFAYLGVNGYRDQDGFVLPFMKGTKYSFTPLGADDKVVKDYEVRYYPTNFIIDQDGRIAYSRFMVGADNEETLKLMIESLL
ncbi:MAG TPA: redoxin domain-containing protein [Chitinophagaceae bacterium]|nr:redoxin domain-containing protein [Chitinophagaceae bacterium]